MFFLHRVALRCRHILIANLTLAVESPFQIVLCMTFLYRILGWR